ncbi:MAG: acylphosphatase, partial [Elusimicrobiota bacterium]
MLKTKKIIINGVVQGVGFRPFIYNLAIEMNINGYVLNSPDGVVIELTAEEEKIKKFIENIRLKKPKESELSSIEISEEKHKNFKDFKILKSENNSFVKTSIPADLSICEDC